MVKRLEPTWDRQESCSLLPLLAFCDEDDSRLKSLLETVSSSCSVSDVVSWDAGISCIGIRLSRQVQLCVRLVNAFSVTWRLAVVTYGSLGGSWGISVSIDMVAMNMAEMLFWGAYNSNCGSRILHLCKQSLVHIDFSALYATRRRRRRSVDARQSGGVVTPDAERRVIERVVLKRNGVRW